MMAANREDSDRQYGVVNVQPEFAAIHELRSDLPVECVTLTAPCFCGPHWSMISRPVPSSCAPGFDGFEYWSRMCELGMISRRRFATPM